MHDARTTRSSAHEAVWQDARIAGTGTKARGHMIRGGLRAWAEGLLGGVACLRTDLPLALKRLLLPVSYWRTAEFAYAWRQMTVPAGSRVLDLGSPKDLAVWFARRRRYAVTSVDVLQAEVDYSARYATARGARGEGPGRVNQLRQDGRALEFPDACFDAAYSISVLEHIPAAGDGAAFHEMVRVVRPGGYIVLTVPYAETYHETFVGGAVYERDYEGEPVFYERHYDTVTLRTRLIEHPHAELIDLELWGERLPVERLLGWNRGVRAVLSPAEPLLAFTALRRVDQGGAKAAFVTLKRV